MKNKVQKLEELFNNLSEFSPENMDQVIQESISTFEEILQKMNSEDEKEKKEGAAAAELLKDMLEKESVKALEQAELSMQELDSYMSDPENFSKEEWDSLEKAKKQFDQYHNYAAEKGLLKAPSHGSKKPKRKRPSLWVRS